jgi:hypothetical protein
LIVGAAITLGSLTGAIAQALGLGRWPSVAIAGIAGVVFVGLGMRFARRLSRT